MQCEKFENRLQWLLDRRQTPESDDQLIAHAATCQSCHGLLAAQESLFHGLDLLETPSPSPDFVDRVLVQVEPSRPIHSWRSWLGPALAIAAALLLAMIPLQVLYFSRPVAQLLNIKPPAPRAPIKSSGDLPRTVEIASDDHLPSATEPSVDLATFSDIWEITSKLPAAASFQRQSPAWIDHVAGGLRPLADSMGVAWNILRRNFPGGRQRQAEEPQAHRAVKAPDLV